LYEAVKKEAAILAKRQDSRLLEKITVELLESVSFPLTNVEVTELDMRAYEEAQDDHDDESVISEENTLTIERINLNINETVDC
jgi:hypothetical protein